MSAFETFAREYAAYGYPVVFPGVLLEDAGLKVSGTALIESWTPSLRAY
jgi:hypothetical protein